MKKTRRNLKNLDQEYQGVDQQSKEILNEQVKRAIENQVTVKHQKNNICSILIQQDKQLQRLQETEIELQEQEKIEYQYLQRNQDQQDVIKMIKVFEELNTLFIQDQIKYYMNNSKLDEINKYLNIDSSIAFDSFNLDSPLIKYNQRNYQDSPTFVTKNSFLDTVIKFYERHPQGALSLSEKLIYHYQLLSSQFEGHKLFYSEYNQTKQEKTQLGQKLLEDLEQLKDFQDDSPKRLQMKQNIKQEINKTQRDDIIQQLFIEKELNPGIKTYLQTQTLVRDSIRFEKNLLYSFMGLAESFIRKAKVLLLMQDDCNVELGNEFKDQITSSLDKINKMIRNDTKIMKRQSSFKKFDFPSGFMKDLGNFKRNLGLKLINQARLAETSPRKDADSDNMLIVFNEYSKILLQNHQSDIQPDKNILEKWILTIKNDNIIYGFANHNMIIHYLQNLNCTEEQKRDPKFTYIFENLHKLKDTAWKNYYLCICDMIELEQNFILTLKQKCIEQIGLLLDLNPKFQLKRIKSSKRLQSQYMQKFPFIQTFQNQNTLIKEQNQEAIQRIENQIDNPEQTVIERKRESSENKTKKNEFDIEFFLLKLKTDGQRKFKKEIENDEIARKKEESERRKSSLLYKTNQENYYQFKEYEHFKNNLDYIKKLEEQLEDYDEDSPIQKKQKENKSVAFRKRMISCDLNKQKQQNKIPQEDLYKPDQIASARKNLALNSNLLKHISKLDALTQSIDQEKLERTLKSQKLCVQDISRNISQSNLVKQKKLSAHLISSSTNKKRNSTDGSQQESFDQKKQDIGSTSSYKQQPQIMNLIRSRAQTNDEKQMKLKKANYQQTENTLKEFDVNMRNQNKTDEELNKNDKKTNFTLNTSESVNKKHKQPIKKSYHQILQSILDEQLKIKNNENVTSIERTQKERQLQIQKNDEKQKKQSKYNIKYDDENMKYEEQSKSHIIIRPQKVQNYNENQIKPSTQQKTTISQQQQSSSALNKFMNLKVHTNENKSLKYLQSNGQD